MGRFNIDLVECKTCGAAVADADKHVAWHVRRGEVPERCGELRCPVDDMSEYLGRQEADYLTWDCGHQMPRPT